MTDRISALMSQLKEGLLGLYGSRLRGLYLFGSYARGEQDDESDVDVLIVLDRLDSHATEIARSSELISATSLSFGVSVSRVFVSEHDWLSADTVFLLNVREEGLAA
jgi:predicted nucleotidyltransferase